MSANGNIRDWFEQAYSNVGAIITESVTNNKVFEGKTFSVRQSIELGSNETKEFFFDATAFGDGFVVLLPPEFSAIGGDVVTVDFYVGATYSGGTEIVGANRDQNIANTPDSKIISDGTVVTAGTKVPISWKIPADSSFFGTTGGRVAESLPFDINKNLIQRLSVINSGTAQTFEYALTWFELPVGE